MMDICYYSIFRFVRDCRLAGFDARSMIARREYISEQKPFEPDHPIAAYRAARMVLVARPYAAIEQ